MKGTKPQLVVDNDPVRTSPRAPAWLSDEAKAEWRRVCPVLVARRILTVGDLGSLENYCVAMGTVREMERTLQDEGHFVQTAHGPKKHPAAGIQADFLNKARLLAAELGLTPVSRSRPAVRSDAEDEDASDLGL